MPNDELLSQVKGSFDPSEPPRQFYRYDLSNSEGRLVEKQCRRYAQRGLDPEKTGELLVDTPILSDEGILFFLFELAQEGLSGVNSHFLYNRLREVDRGTLTVEQARLLDDLEAELKRAEREFEDKEEAEYRSLRSGLSDDEADETQ